MSTMPCKYYTISPAPSLDSPNILSTNVIGTSSILWPMYYALTIISIWNTYPLLLTDFKHFSRTSFLNNLNDPVRSEAAGFNKVLAKKLATLEVNFLLKSHPYTPPPDLYLVPVTTSASVSFCFLMNSGINLGYNHNIQRVNYMMRKVSIHKYNEWTRAKLQTINICAAQSQLSRPSMELYFIFSVYVLKIFYYFLSAIRWIVINYHYFNVNFTNRNS